MPPDLLTPRERQVAELIGRENLSDHQIATRLGISISTVRTHIAAMGLKIPGRGRTKLRIARWWYTRDAGPGG